MYFSGHFQDISGKFQDISVTLTFCRKKKPQISLPYNNTGLTVWSNTRYDNVTLSPLLLQRGAKTD